MAEWPFDEPLDVAVLTIRSVMAGSHPILLVSHDEEDGMWQFLDAAPPRKRDAMVVALSEVYALDPSVGELADLPLGWEAWRPSADAPWQRRPS